MFVACVSTIGKAAAVAALARANLTVASAPGPPIRALLVDSGRSVDAEALAGFPHLEMVATASVGRDHIDLSACAERGIVVRNAPDYCAEEVADSTLAMLLDLLRGLTFSDRQVRGGRWQEEPLFPTRRVAGVRLGLIGCGQIGGRVAVRAMALGMEVWATLASRALPQGVRRAEYSELLRACDAISLHLPLTSATRGVLGRVELRSMREGALVINTSRGALLDLDALLDALDAGLGAAALDVLPEEPPVVLPRHRRLLVTSHIAWWSQEAATAAHLFAAREIARHLGRELGFEAK